MQNPNDPMPTRKKPGPLPGSPTTRYQILLEEELGEWGKHQPGGLSKTIRRLLREERRQQENDRLNEREKR